MAHIEYLAPGDASATGLATGSVDLHCSYTVLAITGAWFVAR